MNTYYRCLLFVILIFSGYTQSVAQQLFLRKHSLPVEYINASIHQIFQDNNGYIWTASDSGLFRYDGFEFKHVAGGGKITAFYNDSKNILWIGYENGSIKSFSNFNNFSRSIKTLPSAIRYITEVSSGLVAATYNDGLFLINDSIIKHLSVKNGLPDNFIYDMSVHEGVLYVATESGIAIVSDDFVVTKVYDREDGLSDDFITNLAKGENSVIYGSSYNGQLFRLDGKGISLLAKVSEGINDVRFYNGSLLTGTETGLFSFDIQTSQVSTFQLKKSFISGKISSLYIDKEGILWLANTTSDLFSGNPSFRIYYPERLTDQTVQALLQDKNGATWFSSARSLQVLNGNKTQSSVVENLNREGANVISICQDRFGSVWFGTYGQGLYVLNTKGKLNHYKTSDRLINNNIFSIANRNDELWLSSIGGISVFRVNTEGLNGLIKNYKGTDGPGSNYIYKIFIDSKNNVWFGTDGAGLTSLQNNKFVAYDQTSGLAGNVVYSITEDNSGNIWFTVVNAGIYRLSSDGNMKQYSTSDGLRDNGLTSIVYDGQGNIMMAGKYGVDVLHIETGNVFYHGEEVGIEDFDPDINALHKNNLGDIWIGGKGKIVQYSGSNAFSQVWPETMISSVSVFLNDTSSINVLPYNMNHISFGFIGLWYHDPAEVVYQVMLEGHDRDWVTSANRFATYPNLPPGKYVFKVRSSASGKFEGAKEVVYPFEIKSPFYKTAWFIILLSLLSFTLIYLIIRWRINAIKRAEAIKKEKIEFEFETLKSQVNPHFLFNSFNTLTAVIEEDKETAVEYVEKLSDFFRNVLMQREKNLINVHEELEQLKLYIFLQKKRYRENFNVVINFDDFEMEDKIAPLTLQLLVENAVKHNVVSRSKPLIVKIYREVTYIVVENNLQRKSVPEPSTGLGLENINRRYNLLTDKKIEIVSDQEKYKVYIPLIK